MLKTLLSIKKKRLEHIIFEIQKKNLDAVTIKTTEIFEKDKEFVEAIEQVQQEIIAQVIFVITNAIRIHLKFHENFC